MDIRIFDSPQTFRLHGRSGTVPNQQFGQVGLRLMNEVWSAVKAAKTETTGINHWVYLNDGRMFVGVELHPGVDAPPGIELLEFTLSRYLQHVHVGPYQMLPGKWAALKHEVAQRGEQIGEHSLEIYGHHDPDPQELQTTILIGLKAKGTAAR